MSDRRCENCRFWKHDHIVYGTCESEFVAYPVTNANRETFPHWHCLYWHAKPENDVRERLAEYAHEAWSGWMQHLFRVSAHEIDGAVTLPISYSENWKRQQRTKYEDLSESEKESDRKEADRILAIVRGEGT